MILDALIIIFIVLGVWHGFKTGFILQATRLISYLVAIFIAYRYSGELSATLSEFIPYPFQTSDGASALVLDLVNAEHAFYLVIAFLILFFGTKLAIVLIAHALNTIAKLPGLNITNKLLGLLLGGLKVFIFVFITVHILFLIPWETGQNWLSNSHLGMYIIRQSPLF